jgi:hypothetical protein
MHRIRDLILCQINSPAHSGGFAVALIASDGQRLFTVEHHIILHSVGKVTPSKFDAVFKKTRALFVD